MIPGLIIPGEGQLHFRVKLRPANWSPSRHCNVTSNPLQGSAKAVISAIREVTLPFCREVGRLKERESLVFAPPCCGIVTLHCCLDGQRKSVRTKHSGKRELAFLTLVLVIITFLR